MNVMMELAIGAAKGFAVAIPTMLIVRHRARMVLRNNFKKIFGEIVKSRLDERGRHLKGAAGSFNKEELDAVAYLFNRIGYEVENQAIAIKHRVDRCGILAFGNTVLTPFELSFPALKRACSYVSMCLYDMYDVNADDLGSMHHRNKFSLEVYQPVNGLVYLTLEFSISTKGANKYMTTLSSLQMQPKVKKQASKTPSE